jgi:hypothetical protein
MALAVVSSNSQWFFKVSHINWVSAEVLEVASGFALAAFPFASLSRKSECLLPMRIFEIFVTGLDTATLDSDSATRSRRSRAPSTICFSTVLVVRRYTGLTTGLFVPEKAHPILSSLQKWSCLSLFGEGPGWRFYGDVVAPYIYDMYFFQG